MICAKCNYSGKHWIKWLEGEDLMKACPGCKTVIIRRRQKKRKVKDLPDGWEQLSLF